MNAVNQELYDSNAALFVLGYLLHNPLIIQDDAYTLAKTDFKQPIQQIIFTAIFNMAQQGFSSIGPVDIDLYLKQFSNSYDYYQRNKGFELVLNIVSMTEESKKDSSQFDYYYNRVKKFSMLRDLQLNGFDISPFYDVSNSFTNLDTEDEKLNNVKLGDIPERIRKLLVDIESRHSGRVGVTGQNVAKGLRNLVAELRESPEIGLALDGNIFNYACRGGRLGKLYTYSAPTGAGKALPNSTLIPMADGSWKTVGQVQPGDFLIDRHGKPTQVLKVFPQGEKEIYQVTFKDGRTAKCCKDHLWTYHNVCARDDNQLETDTLETLIQKINTLGIKSDKAWRYSIPLNDAVNYPTQEYKLEPYLLGLLLGDGSFREQPTNRNLSFSDGREELVKAFTTLGWTYHRSSLKNYNYYFKDVQGHNVHVKEFCDQYNIPELYHALTEDKVIPHKYLIGDIQQRLDLLNGLLDTDGTVDEKGRIRFTTINYTLAQQVQQLCYSLGFTCTIGQDKRTDKYSTKACYNLTISGAPEKKKQLFRLSYKKERVLNWYHNNKRKEKGRFNSIVGIQKLEDSEQMTCFLVDNDEHLFLMNDYIVTHNTRHMVGNACAISLPYIENGKVIVKEGLEKVLFVATEMSADEIQTLIISYVSGVSEDKLLLGRTTLEERTLIDQAIDIIEQYADNFIIEAIPDPSISLVRSTLVKYIVQNNIQYIFYDYIFSSPGLLGEFSSIGVREDVALMLLTNEIKAVAMKYQVFIESATQLNDGWSKQLVRNQNCLRGSKAISDKIDLGAIGVRLEESDEEFAKIKEIIKQKGFKIPNIVIDIYKNRRGPLVGVKIFRYFDYGTCRCEDIMMTDTSYRWKEESNIKVEYDTKSYEIEEFLGRGVNNND